MAVTPRNQAIARRRRSGLGGNPAGTPPRSLTLRWRDGVRVLPGRALAEAVAVTEACLPVTPTLAMA
jgi:hypothetical protein